MKRNKLLIAVAVVFGLFSNVSALFDFADSAEIRTAMSPAGEGSGGGTGDGGCGRA